MKPIVSIPKPMFAAMFVASNMFAVKKKSNGNEPQLYRAITNLKRLNVFIRYEHFKMENLDLVRFIFPKADWMVKAHI